jgi:response regulator RpfG family c-di-GMP phosphodiesterase
MFPMNGLELLCEIRKKWHDLPVMMVTAFVSAETIEEATQLGVVAYLTKPFSHKEVLNAVRRALDTPRSSVNHLTLQMLADKYMRKEQIPTIFEAKAALADHLYWLSKDHPKEQLLPALKQTMGTEDIPIEYVTGLLDFRETMIRVKNLIGAAAQAEGKDPAAFLREVSRAVADTFAGINGDAAAALSRASGLLASAKGTVTPGDVKFLVEYCEDSTSGGDPTDG